MLSDILKESDDIVNDLLELGHLVKGSKLASDKIYSDIYKQQVNDGTNNDPNEGVFLPMRW